MTIGYKFIVTTDKSKDEVGLLLDKVLDKVSNNTRMNMIIEMSEEEVEKEFQL